MTDVQKLSEWMRSIKQSGASIGRHDMDECVVISTDVIDLVADLEADADALLLMKEPLREIAFAPLDVHPADDELAFYKRELQRCIGIAARALAALPEHLKEETKNGK